MSRRPRVIAAVTAIALGAGFLLLARSHATSEAVIAFDAMLGAGIRSLRSEALTRVMIAITYAGGFTAALVLSAACTALLLKRGRTRDATVLLAVMASLPLLTAVAKAVIGRERPPAEFALLALPPDFSFPSGHTSASLALGGVLCYLSLRSSMSRAGRMLSAAGALAYPVVVGTSRVYLGVHWSSDVLAAWMLGGTVLAIAIGWRESLR